MLRKEKRKKERKENAMQSRTYLRIVVSQPESNFQTNIYLSQRGLYTRAPENVDTVQDIRALFETYRSSNTKRRIYLSTCDK